MMLPLTPRLRKVPIAYGTTSLADFAARSTREAREVVRKRIAELAALREWQARTHIESDDH